MMIHEKKMRQPSFSFSEQRRKNVHECMYMQHSAFIAVSVIMPTGIVTDLPEVNKTFKFCCQKFV
jgi:hypothetical protein